MSHSCSPSVQKSGVPLVTLYFSYLFAVLGVTFQALRETGSKTNRNQGRQISDTRESQPDCAELICVLTPTLKKVFSHCHCLRVYTARSSWRGRLLPPLVLLRRRLSLMKPDCRRGHGEQLWGSSTGSWSYLILRKSDSSSRLSQL